MGLESGPEAGQHMTFNVYEIVLIVLMDQQEEEHGEEKRHRKQWDLSYCISQ